jgi:DNA-binding NarL/FixJ family response regulator
MHTTVLLVDNRRVLRDGLRALLEKHDDIRIIGEAEETGAAVKLAEALRPRLAVLSLGSPAFGGVERVRLLANARYSCRVVALFLQLDATLIRHVLAAGAAACLTKDAASDELLTAIRTVAAGKIYLSQRITETVLNGYVSRSDNKSRRKELSARERDVLRRIADGETTKEIAGHLEVSGRTVETYRRRIMEKLGIQTVADLIKYAVREGLTSLDVAN